MLERIAPFVERRMRNNPNLAKKMYGPLGKKIIERYLKKYKFYKLKKTLAHAYDNSSFYKKLFNNAKIKLEDIKSFKDLEKIPFTNAKDLQKPKDFFAVPESKFVRVATTSGTTGEPKRIYLTNDDLEKEIAGMATGMRLLYGINESDTVHLIIESGCGIEIWGGGYRTERALEKIGAMTIFNGHRLSPELELKVMEIYKPTIIVSTTSYLNYLTEEMKKICDLKKFGIKKLFSNSEPLPLSIREKMEMEWGADVFETYGLVEIGISVAGECKQKNGMHVDESSFFIEVVDPKTGEQLENGELGELVFTTLNREGMPLIRYRSHDLGSIIAEECECGSPLQRIKIKGRTDDMVIIGTGDNVFAEMFDKALFSLPEVMEYQIVLNKKNARDHMAITVETDSTSDKTREKILKSLFKIDAIRDGIMNSKTIAKPSIKLVKPGTIDRKIKVKKIIDNRNLYS